jgi:hypothetical protein
VRNSSNSPGNRDEVANHLAASDAPRNYLALTASANTDLIE